jgi:integrase
MATAWTFQDDKQVKKHGEHKASWYVGWIDPGGKKKCKSCGAGPVGKANAEKLRRIREAELLTGTYQSADKKTWDAFRAEYNDRIACKMLPQTRRLTMEALDHFERLINPKRMLAISTQTIDDYISKRRLEPGKQKGETLRAASLNKELRHLRAVFRIAGEWKYLPAVPRFRMLREPGKLATFIAPEHFAAVYAACDQAESPADIPTITAGDWWRALLVMAYMTGWRIGELLALRRSDVDLEAGVAITRAEDNKGKRTEQIKLHPVVVEHLRKLPAFDQRMFPWNGAETALYKEFHRLQDAAGVRMTGNSDHRHYGFHDLRRAFATQNAPRLTADALQKLMRHKSYLTTQRYINMASQLDESVAILHVPAILQKVNA